MSAAAAAAWVHFAAASGGALCLPTPPDAALTPELTAAVDGVMAAGLAPLVPAQLLGAASAALQAQLARLREALAPVCAATLGGDAAEGDADSFSDDMEAALADALRVCGWVRGQDGFLEAAWRAPQALCQPTPPIPWPLLQDTCDAVESATQLLARLCERVLRSQPALSTADRSALAAAGQRFRREAAAAVVGAQAGSWAGRCMGVGAGITAGTGRRAFAAGDA